MSNSNTERCPGSGTWAAVLVSTGYGCDHCNRLDLRAHSRDQILDEHTRTVDPRKARTVAAIASLNASAAQWEG
jgi:hypothetical protein